MLPIRNNQTVDGVSVFDFEATRGESLAARAGEAWVRSPFSSMIRMMKMGTFDPLNVFGFQGNEFLRQDEAGKLIGAAGVELNIKEPFVSRKKLEILIEQKQKEQIRKDTIARGPQDGVTYTLGFFTELGMTLMDPINIASAFIPIVGEARFAQLVGRFGKIGARAIKGVAEGAVGAAAVEPLILLSANEEQADYDMTNSLLNIAFGAVAGGGLHVVGGAVGDKLNLRSRLSRVSSMSERIALADPRTRQAALRSSVALVSEGRRPNAELTLAEDAAFTGDTRQAARMSGEEIRFQERLSDQAEEFNAETDTLSDLEIPVENIRNVKIEPGAADEGPAVFGLDEQGNLTLKSGVTEATRILESGKTSELVNFSPESRERLSEFLLNLAEDNRARVRRSVKDDNLNATVQDAEQKLSAENSRLNSPESSFVTNMDAAREADVREPGIKPDADEELATELLQQAEDVIAQNAEMLASADPELRADLGLAGKVEDMPDIKGAIEFGEKMKLHERAIRALAACLGRG